MAKDTIHSIKSPEYRRLWIYAIDPWAESSLATAVVSRCVLPVRWEKLEPGPVGAYVEVIDVDPSSNCVYDPADLETLHIVANDGLSPSEGSPRFHQQMVYSVVMKTIENFERALGRQILWAPRKWNEDGKRLSREARYVPCLRIYPHALREANAYYSPNKKAILFGYFNAPIGEDREDLPGGMVFTCLSHDIIAHETTHAILDGIHRRLLEPTNGDMLAFHEAFGDIAAIFQHFTLPGLVLDQIRQTRGDLRLNNLLASLAEQLALNLDNDTNNTSLSLAFELGPARQGLVFLFTGDAQVGNWLSWRSQEYKAGSRTLSADDLLARTVLYKVAHHGSHNATVRRDPLHKSADHPHGEPFGLELMPSKLTALIPVDQAAVRKRMPTPWHMPHPPLYRRLLEKTGGRVLRSDGLSPRSEGISVSAQSPGDSKAKAVSGLTKTKWRKSRAKFVNGRKCPLYYDLIFER